MRAEKTMKALYTRRRQNLAKLAIKHGTASALSAALGYRSRTTVSYLLSGVRPITEGTARRIEEKLKLPAGWLDAKQPGGNGK